MSFRRKTAISVLALVACGALAAPSAAMTKVELARAMSGKGLTNAQATKAIDAFIREVKKSLRTGEPVYLNSFGNFAVEHQTRAPNRTSPTPTSRKVPVFRPDKSFWSK